MTRSLRFQPNFPDGFAHDHLRLAPGIAFGTVEKVDARIERGFHTVEGDLVADVTAICDPAAERDH